MLTKTSTPENLLDVMEELELLHVEFSTADGWIKVTDRKTLYRAAITALLECAHSEGFGVEVTGDHCDVTDEYEVEPCESCESSGTNEDGSTCADCKGFGSIMHKIN